MKISLILFLSVFSVYQKINYQIISFDKDNRGIVNQIFVYVNKQSDIKPLNKLLFEKYRKTGVATFQIYYFDNKHIAKIYEKSLFNSNVSNAQSDRISQHVIGKFVYDGQTSSLHVGKGADNY